MVNSFLLNFIKLKEEPVFTLFSLLYDYDRMDLLPGAFT